MRLASKKAQNFILLCLFVILIVPLWFLLLLFALKLCDSLFPIGVQSLGGVGAGEGLRQQFALEGEAFPLASLNSALDRSFDQPHGPARFVRRHELPRVTQNLVEEVRSLENLVNQSKVARLLEGDDAA